MFKNKILGNEILWKKVFSLPSIIPAMAPILQKTTELFSSLIFIQIIVKEAQLIPRINRETFHSDP